MRHFFTLIAVHGSPPFLTTRDRELVSLLEVRIELGDQTDYSTLLWMVIGIKLVRCVGSAAGQCFGSIIVPPVHFEAFLHSLK